MVFSKTIKWFWAGCFSLEVCICFVGRNYALENLAYRMHFCISNNLLLLCPHSYSYTCHLSSFQISVLTSYSLLPSHLLENARYTLSVGKTHEEVHMKCLSSRLYSLYFILPFLLSIFVWINACYCYYYVYLNISLTREATNDPTCPNLAHSSF